MFQKERFIEECRAALEESDPRAAIRELVARAVSEPAHIVRALGEPKRAGVETIYRANDLTILNLCWGPRMVFKPHDTSPVGCHWHLWRSGAEHLLLPQRARPETTRNQGTTYEEHDPAGYDDYPRRYESAGSDYRGNPCLRRRFLRDPSQRMEPPNV